MIVYVSFSFSVVPLKVGGPHLDIKSTGNLTKHLKKRLYLTKRLLELKELSKKKQIMAVNLDSLLPQALAGDTASPIVPCNFNFNVFHVSEFTSPGSLFGNEIGPGFDKIAADYGSSDDSYFKAETFYKESNGVEFEKIDYDRLSPNQTPGKID